MIRIEGVIMRKNQRQKEIIERQMKEIADLKERIERYAKLYEGKQVDVPPEDRSETAGEADSEEEIDVEVVIQHLRDYQNVIAQVPEYGLSLYRDFLKARDLDVAKCIVWLSKYQWGD